MKRIFKWIAIVLGAVVGLLLVGVLSLYLIGNAGLNKVYDVPPSNLTIPTDAESIAFGEHRADTLCESCHGQNLAGGKFFEDPAMGILDAANLTTGEGGVGRKYTSDEDYVRAIRHGIDQQGKPIFMPAVTSTANLSDQDLAAIIAYLKTVPPVDNVTRPRNLKPMAKILMGAGMFPPLPAAMVNHEINLTAPERGVSVAYGEYLVSTNDCRECHGHDLAGTEYPDPTVYLITPNITPGGEVGFWSEADFINTIRTGVNPGKHQLDNEHMPWETYKLFTDDELKAIYMYLQSLPKLPQYTD